jgi:hypothetical protein
MLMRIGRRYAVDYGMEQILLKRTSSFAVSDLVGFRLGNAAGPRALPS